jgi:hypothetical protein
MAGNILSSIAILMAMINGGKASSATEIAIGSTAALPGDVVFVDVTLANNDLCIYSIYTVFTYHPAIPIVQPGSRLPCQPTSSLIFNDLANSFYPPGCATGECVGVEVQGVVIDSHPPVDSLLWRCAFAVAPGTPPGVYPLDCLQQTIDTCEIQRVEVGCTPGSIDVHGCVGDCDRDGATTVADLVLAVNIALQTTVPSQCPAADSNGDGRISIDELVAGVFVLLNGCAVPGAT